MANEENNTDSATSTTSTSTTDNVNTDASNSSINKVTNTAPRGKPTPRLMKNTFKGEI